VSLPDLAAASAFMNEMSMVLGSINAAIERDEATTPPVVHVESGSIEFAVGGGLFASGISLIVGCCAGLVPSPLVGTIGGATLATVGLIELAIDWKLKIAEISKTYEEIRGLRLEHDPVVTQQSRRLQELEIQAKEIDLEIARTRQREPKKQKQILASSTLPRELVKAEAKRWGLTEEYANLVLNRGFPTYSALRKYFKEIQASIQDDDTDWRPDKVSHNGLFR